MSLYAGNCSEHVCTLLIGYRSGGMPGFHTFSGRVTELRAVDEGAVPASAPATSRLFVLPITARRWVSIDNSGVLGDSGVLYPRGADSGPRAWCGDVFAMVGPLLSCCATRMDHPSLRSNCPPSGEEPSRVLCGRVASTADLGMAARGDCS